MRCNATPKDDPNTRRKDFPFAPAREGTKGRALRCGHDLASLVDRGARRDFVAPRPSHRVGAACPIPQRLVVDSRCARPAFSGRIGDANFLAGEFWQRFAAGRRRCAELARQMHPSRALRFLVAVVVLGITNASYRAYNVYGLFDVPQFGSGDSATARSINSGHEWAANLIVLVALFHAAAALGHQYIWRDHLLARMGAGGNRRSQGNRPADQSSRIAG